jgi:hypothetical protein
VRRVDLTHDLGALKSIPDMVAFCIAEVTSCGSRGGHDVTASAAVRFLHPSQSTMLSILDSTAITACTATAHSTASTTEGIAVKSQPVREFYPFRSCKTFELALGSQ